MGKASIEIQHFEQSALRHLEESVIHIPDIIMPKFSSDLNTAKEENPQKDKLHVEFIDYQMNEDKVIELSSDQSISPISN